ADQSRAAGYKDTHRPSSLVGPPPGRPSRDIGSPRASGRPPRPARNGSRGRAASSASVGKTVCKARAASVRVVVVKGPGGRWGYRPPPTGGSRPPLAKAKKEAGHEAVGSAAVAGGCRGVL